MRAALHNLRSFEACDCHMYPGSISPDQSQRSYPTLTLPHDRILDQAPACCQLAPIPPFQASQFGATLLQGILHFHISWINHVGTPFQTRQLTCSLTLFGVRPHGPMLVDSKAAMRYRPMSGKGYAHGQNTHTGLGTWIRVFGSEPPSSCLRSTL